MIGNKITFCVSCPFCEVINDRDPEDWFNDDDCAVVCKLKLNDERKPTSKYLSDHSEFKVVECACRPYEVRNVQTPDWCPLRTK